MKMDSMCFANDAGETHVDREHFANASGGTNGGWWMAGCQDACMGMHAMHGVCFASGDGETHMTQ